jgi:uncharacterized protein Veg
MNLKLNLKVLSEIHLDLQRIEGQLVRVRNEEARKKIQEELKDLQNCAKKLFDHYKTVLEKQV